MVISQNVIFTKSYELKVILNFFGIVGYWTLLGGVEYLNGCIFTFSRYTFTMYLTLLSLTDFFGNSKWTNPARVMYKNVCMCRGGLILFVVIWFYKKLAVIFQNSILLAPAIPAMR